MAGPGDHASLDTAGTPHHDGVAQPRRRGAHGAAARLAQSLQPSRRAADDFSQPPAPYRPGPVAVTFNDSAVNRDQMAMAWPLSGVEPIRSGCVVLTGMAAEQAQALGEIVTRTGAAAARNANFHAWVRPLLPDETDCRATERHYRS